MLPIVMEIQNVLMVPMRSIVVSNYDILSSSKTQLSISINHSSSATDAPTTIAVAQTTQSSGNEIDRAKAREATTDMAEATLPQVSVLDSETSPPPGVMTP